MTRNHGLLTGFRVLDLTDEKGDFCGKILGDFGADVIKIEPPGGSSARNIGPFCQDSPHPEKSLSWFAFNTSKRGITLDIEQPAGQEILKRLVKTAHFVLESFRPGFMQSLGLGYADLERLKPDIILTSITPFGQSGPYSDYQATDLVGLAMGGLMSLLGDSNRPARISSGPQAYLQVGLQAAMASVMAHYHRQVSGEGQHVDVSMQEAVVLTAPIVAETYELMKVNLSGTGPCYFTARPEPYGPIYLQYLLPCKDGHVLLQWSGGHPGFVRSTQAVLKWANEEGMAKDVLDIDLVTWNTMTIPQETVDRMKRALMQFLMTRTKAELFRGALERGIMMAPCNTTADILRDAHLEARGYWEKVAHPELGRELTYAGAPLKMTSNSWEIRCRAPLIGEHNSDIYGKELGLTPEDLSLLKTQNVI
jgi:crotonobetainyl-CoA:carnitine CoA-transferase CaiB-like acyl-CoA transferase